VGTSLLPFVTDSTGAALPVQGGNEVLDTENGYRECRGYCHMCCQRMGPEHDLRVCSRCKRRTHFDCMDVCLRCLGRYCFQCYDVHVGYAVGCVLVPDLALFSAADLPVSDEEMRVIRKANTDPKMEFDEERLVLRAICETEDVASEYVESGILHTCPLDVFLVANSQGRSAGFREQQSQRQVLRSYREPFIVTVVRTMELAGPHFLFDLDDDHVVDVISRLSTWPSRQLPFTTVLEACLLLSVSTALHQLPATSMQEERM